MNAHDMRLTNFFTFGAHYSPIKFCLETSRINENNETGETQSTRKLDKLGRAKFYGFSNNGLNEDMAGFERSIEKIIYSEPNGCVSVECVLRVSLGEENYENDFF